MVDAVPLAISMALNGAAKRWTDARGYLTTIGDYDVDNFLAFAVWNYYMTISEEVARETQSANLKGRPPPPPVNVTNEFVNAQIIAASKHVLYDFLKRRDYSMKPSEYRATRLPGPVENESSHSTHLPTTTDLSSDAKNAASGNELVATDATQSFTGNSSTSIFLSAIERADIDRLTFPAVVMLTYALHAPARATNAFDYLYEARVSKDGYDWCATPDDKPNLQPLSVALGRCVARSTTSSTSKYSMRYICATILLYVALAFDASFEEAADGVYDEKISLWFRHVRAEAHRRNALPATQSSAAASRTSVHVAIPITEICRMLRQE